MHECEVDAEHPGEVGAPVGEALRGLTIDPTEVEEARGAGPPQRLVHLDREAAIAREPAIAEAEHAKAGAGRGAR